MLKIVVLVYFAEISRVFRHGGVNARVIQPLAHTHTKFSRVLNMLVYRRELFRFELWSTVIIEYVENSSFGQFH